MTRWIDILQSQLQEFADVPIYPTDEVLAAPAGALFRGGPHWPDFNLQTTARHCRGLVATPVDVEPSTRKPEKTIEVGVWCGPIVTHFGHMIADFGMRIAQSAYLHPDLPLVFSGPPSSRKEFNLPGFVSSILKALGADPSRVIVVTEPIMVRRLLVYPQAERMNGGGPTATHLHLMDYVRKDCPSSSLINTIYVSRSRYLAGGIAGEWYINRAMNDAGVFVLAPELVPLQLQLQLLGSAKRIIFSEGSAVHTLQLLGTVDADITVICRRPNARIAEASLLPRARSVEYIDCVRRNIFGLRPSGHKHESRGISFLKKGTLRKRLSDIVPPLRDHWDNDRFFAAQVDDVHRWVQAMVHSQEEAQMVLEGLQVIGVPIPDDLTRQLKT